MRWLDRIIASKDMTFTKLWERVKDRGLVCCSPWGHKASETTQRLESSNNGEEGRGRRAVGGDRALCGERVRVGETARWRGWGLLPGRMVRFCSEKTTIIAMANTRTALTPPTMAHFQHPLLFAMMTF